MGHPLDVFLIYRYVHETSKFEIEMRPIPSFLIPRVRDETETFENASWSSLCRALLSQRTERAFEFSVWLRQKSQDKDCVNVWSTNCKSRCPLRSLSNNGWMRPYKTYANTFERITMWQSWIWNASLKLTFPRLSTKRCWNGRCDNLTVTEKLRVR